MFSKKYRGKIDYSSEARINFIERMSSIMINFVSISDEVNQLINLLYSKLTRIKANYNIFHDKESKKEYKVDKHNKVRIEVNDNDIFLYGYAIMLYEYNSWRCDDVLDQIIKDLYYKLYGLVYPRISKKDNEMYRFYIEYECDKEQK
ncbi:MAG: hypothetical protein IJ568_01485 [Bacilli bacterium]|nr:hypothetical protein [Bacilli bacterium]